MADNKNRQQIVLLHGESAFTETKAAELELALGELVVEHGDAVKLHTKGKDGKLATFVDQKEVEKLVGVVSTDLAELEAVVGGENEGLVKDVTDIKSDLADVMANLGLTGETGSLSEKVTEVVKDVQNLEELLNGKADDEDDKGLVGQVAANAGSISQNAENITALQTSATTVAARVDAVETGVTANADAITAETATRESEIARVEALVSGNTGTIASNLEKINGLTERMDAAETGVTANAAAVKANADAITAETETRKSEVARVEALVTAETATTAAFRETQAQKNNELVAEDERLAGLISAETETRAAEDLKLQNSITGLTERVAAAETGVTANAAAIVTLEEKHDKAVEAMAFTGVAEGMIITNVTQENGTVSATGKATSAFTWDAEQVKYEATNAEGYLASATDVQTALDTLDAVDAQLAGEIAEVEKDVEDLAKKLYGEGADSAQTKTVRQIAAEEIAAQLIAPDAADALDSLQEIAQWIQEHPEDAAAMNVKISDLEKVLAGYVTVDESGEKVYTKVADQVAALQTEDARLNNAITAETQARVEAVSAVTADVEQLEKDVYGFDTTEGDKTTHTAGLKERMEAAEVAISGNTASISTIQEQLQNGVGVVKEIKITDGVNTVGATIADGGIATLNVSALRIDGGSY
jgi:chromosome segregation ATPase